jgi:hypothetical protein
MKLPLLSFNVVKVGNPSNIITGCTILDNGKVLFSEYNSNEYTARVTLNDSNGNFIRTVQELESTEESFYDITRHTKYVKIYI